MANLFTFWYKSSSICISEVVNSECEKNKNKKTPVFWGFRYTKSEKYKYFVIFSDPNISMYLVTKYSDFLKLFRNSLLGESAYTVSGWLVSWEFTCVLWLAKGIYMLFSSCAADQQCRAESSMWAQLRLADSIADYTWIKPKGRERFFHGQL